MRPFIDTGVRRLLRCVPALTVDRAVPASVYRRALMYVPASDERKLSKVAGMRADCIVLDCEDGVAMSRKAEARSNVAKMLKEHNQRKICHGELGCRVNSVSSGLLEEDLRALSDAQVWPDAFMLPKVDSVQDVKTFFSLFSKYMRHVGCIVNLVIWIETAAALLKMDAILTACATIRHQCPILMDGVVFGSDDYCADIGITRTKEAGELLFARQFFVTACKAHRLQAIDIVYIDVKDLEGLRAQCLQGRSLGFTGKQVIHPSHIPIVEEAFLPPLDSFKYAKELLEAFEKVQLAGKGAFNFRGEMIDMPLVLQAKRVVSIFERLGKA